MIKPNSVDIADAINLMRYGRSQCTLGARVARQRYSRAGTLLPEVYSFEIQMLRVLMHAVCVGWPRLFPGAVRQSLRNFAGQRFGRFFGARNMVLSSKACVSQWSRITGWVDNEYGESFTCGDSLTISSSCIMNSSISDCFLTNMYHA